MIVIDKKPVSFKFKAVVSVDTRDHADVVNNIFR